MNCFFCFSFYHLNIYGIICKEKLNNNASYGSFISPEKNGVEIEKNIIFKIREIKAIVCFSYYLLNTTNPVIYNFSHSLTYALLYINILLGKCCKT